MMTTVKYGINQNSLGTLTYNDYILYSLSGAERRPQAGHRNARNALPGHQEAPISARGYSFIYWNYLLLRLIATQQ